MFSIDQYSRNAQAHYDEQFESTHFSDLLSQRKKINHEPDETHEKKIKTSTKEDRTS